MSKQLNPKLSEQQKEVIFNKGTEAPFSSELLEHNKTGSYTCANCGAELFTSHNKYHSDTPGLAGWPSFADVAKNGSVKLLPDDSIGMHRTEVVCAKCGGHLGHLFDDADSPSGKHYCINGCVLDFKPKGT